MFTEAAARGGAITQSAPSEALGVQGAGEGRLAGPRPEDIQALSHGGQETGSMQRGQL